MQTYLSSLIVCLGLLSGFTRADDSPGQNWQAGVARVSITPEQFMWMSGYAARTNPADGKLHDLFARALVLQDPQGRRAVLVTMDLVGIDRDLSVAIREDIQKQHGLAREAIMLSVTHTHSGPVIRGNLDTMYFLDETQQRYRKEYTEKLHQDLVALVGAALKDLAPALFFRGQGFTTFAANRRNNPEREVPKLRTAGKLKGPADHDVPVLAVRTPAGQLRAIVCGYACHATTLDGYLWSGDFPGFAMENLEKSHSGTIALFWAGCGADQNPIPRRSVALAEAYGKKLSDAVDNVLDGLMTPVPAKLRTAYTEIDLPFVDLPSRDQILKDTMDKNKYVASRAKYLLQRIEKEGSLKGTYPYPVQAWRLGDDLVWVALGGEVVVDYALRLKKELGPGPVWVAGYCNDVMAYIPSLRVLKEGGYEGGGAMVYYGLPTVWGAKIEELIVEAVHQHVRNTTGK